MSTDPFRPAWHGARAALAALAIGLAALAGISSARAAQKEFRVCADPNNLPFSNEKGEGFENKLAELVAGELGDKVTYTWWAQRRGFVRNTLKAGKCDVVMGVPTLLDMVETTRPYYRSSYVFVYRADRRLDLASIKDPHLKTLKIGVVLIGNDGFNTPPSHALGEQGIINNVVGYSIYGDYRKPNPPARIIDAVVRGDIDVAAVWGPLGGYFAKHAPVPLKVIPITHTESFSPLRFQFDISMGVRKGDHVLHRELDQIITRKQPEITALLKSFGVPLLAPRQPATRAAERSGPSQ